MIANPQEHPLVSTINMHSSFSTLAQLMGSRCSRLSQHTEHESMHVADIPRSPPPLTANRIPRTSDGRPVISEPIAKVSVDHLESGGRTRKVASTQQSPSHDTCPASRSMRRPSEMPLSCHPPSQQSWLEVQPLTTHIVKSGPRPVQGVSHANEKASSLATTRKLKEPPRSRSHLPEHESQSVSQLTPKIQSQKQEYDSKPTTSINQTSTSTNHFDKPIAPLRSHIHTENASHPRISSHQPVSVSTHTHRTTVSHTHSHSHSHNYPPIPSALHTLWARRRSSHVILADSPLQLKLFSELNVALDEVMSLYTPDTELDFGTMLQ